MGTFEDLLQERKGVILERWVDAVLSAYPPESAVLFLAQQDPFANPLGHRVREGTRGIFQAILDGVGRDELRTHLDKIVRVRAVQQIAPGEALSFVFTLRAIVRQAIPEAEANSDLREGLTDMDAKIDEVALAAFELYAARREEVSQLRINEVKRQGGWLLGKMRRQREIPDDRFESSTLRTSTSEITQREDLR